MRHRTRWLVYAVVLLTMIGAFILGRKPGPSSAQDAPLSQQKAPFKTYLLGVYCGSPEFPTAKFIYHVREERAMGGTEICAGKCGGRIVSLADALAKLPAEVADALRDLVAHYEADVAAGNGQPPLPCLKSGAKSQPEKKCEKPTPWFGAPPSGCKDVRTPVVTVTGGNAEVTICGQLVFRYSHQNADYVVVDSAYRGELIDFIKSRMGSKVCCDSFQDRMQSAGSACNPARDLDCDGRPNETDTTSLNRSMPNSLPDINIFTQPDNSSVDPFPPGLDPNDAEFFPPADKCDCKWELKKGTLTCSPDGTQRHVYQAWWRCPSTGNERFTRKEAPATAPCTAPNR